MNGFLDQAFAEAQRRLEHWRRKDVLGVLRSMDRTWPKFDFARSIRAGKSIALIAEFKRSSPSKGWLGADSALESCVRSYVEGGAAAVSILTEPRWFNGSLKDLVSARRTLPVPILRKDFIVDEYDLEISREAGADAILLIAANFQIGRLQELLTCARGLGLAALVETHDESDVKTACQAGADIIGVNSRNLKTLKVDVERAVGVLREIPSSFLKVLESGVGSTGDVQRAFDAGADAVLVGELLMRSDDPAETIRGLLSHTKNETSALSDHLATA